MCRSKSDGHRRCGQSAAARAGHNARRRANRAMQRAATAWASEHLTPEATRRIAEAAPAESRQVAINEGVPAHLVHPAIGENTPAPVPRLHLASLADYGFRPAGSLRYNPDEDTLDEESFTSTLWSSSLTDEETAAIEDYTANDHDVLNGALKRGTADSLPLTYQAFIGHLDSALAKATKTNEPRMMYRGVRVPESWTADEVRERISQAYPTGSTADFKTYLSTSLKPSIATGFSRGAIPVMYEMKSSGGANLEDVSNMPGEHEILFGRDTRWRVAGVSTNARTVRADWDDYGEVDVVIVHLVEEHEAQGETAGAAPGLAPMRRDFQYSD